MEEVFIFEEWRKKIFCKLTTDVRLLVHQAGHAKYVCRK